MMMDFVLQSCGYITFYPVCISHVLCLDCLDLLSCKDQYD